MEQKDWNEYAIPFWVIASDGVTYRRPRQRRILVMAGGQREEILLQFDQPGTYVISQQGIQGMQFFDMYGHPHDQILGTIVVEETETPDLPTMPIEQMTFTPGYADDEDIQAHDIAKTETIVFSMGANRDEAPFPQYFVNGKSFDPKRMDFFAQPGEAREYILINANHNVRKYLYSTVYLLVCDLCMVVMESNVANTSHHHHHHHPHHFLLHISSFE
jgi:FtsP/CotA-like multicopper oxidase with cupredoxin domain